MGRGVHCTVEKRLLIRKLISEGKSYKEVQNIIGCSPTMVRNAIKYTPTSETRGRPPVLSKKGVTRIVRYSKQNPFAAATEIKDKRAVEASVETIRRRLRDANLAARSPRKVPLLKKMHVDKRLKFAKEHLDWPIEKWRNILWTDESKIVLYGGKGSRAYVRRPPNSEYNPKFTLKTVKHGGSSVMIWGCFSFYGVGPIYWIKDIMDRHLYVKILQEVMLPYAEDEMPLIWTFQQDNDPKHTSLLAKQWFAENNIRVMEWPAQSPDLNPIENLWCDVKAVVAQRKPTSNSTLWDVVKDAWESIPVERCQNLVNSMPRRCAAVIANKGFATKY